MLLTGLVSRVKIIRYTSTKSTRTSPGNFIDCISQLRRRHFPLQLYIGDLSFSMNTGIGRPDPWIDCGRPAVKGRVSSL
jgi:hypothetical protein